MNSAASDTPKPKRTPASPPRLLATIAIVFLIVFLFLRVGFVEPFGVPTGSMAPTLIGNHREAPCPRWGCRRERGSRSEGKGLRDGCR